MSEAFPRYRYYLWQLLPLEVSHWFGNVENSLKYGARKRKQSKVKYYRRKLQSRYQNLYSKRIVAPVVKYYRLDWLRLLCTFVIIEVHTKMLWSKPWIWQEHCFLKSMTSALFKLENATGYLMPQDNQLFSYACSCTQGWTLANMTSPLGWIQTLHDKDCSVNAQEIALPKRGGMCSQMWKSQDQLKLSAPLGIEDPDSPCTLKCKLLYPSVKLNNYAKIVILLNYTYCVHR